MHFPISIPAPSRFSYMASAFHEMTYIPSLLVLNVGNGWVAGGCWDDKQITSDDLWIIPDSIPSA